MTQIESNIPLIKIEKDVPMPTIRARSGTWINTLSKMDVGDSFFAAYPNGDRTRISCYQAAKRLKIKTTSRYEYNDDGMRGVRIWRIK